MPCGSSPKGIEVVKVNKEEVQSIILMTLRELKRQNLLKDTYSVVLKEVEPVIKEYFHRKNNKEIELFLVKYSDDPYIDIIYLHYRDSITIERIAELMDKDISTIKRNKKRLIISMYEHMEGSYEY